MQQAEPADDRFLGDYLFHESPAQLAIVGSLPDALLDASPAGIEVLRFDTLLDAEAMAMTPQQSAQSGHRALVLKVEAGHGELALRLGRAVRAFPHRVLLHIHTPPNTPPPANETFYAFGFRVLPVMQDKSMQDGHTYWYEYRLSNYKSAPDWLNARFWANPERFDLLENPDEYCDEFDDEEE